MFIGSCINIHDDGRLKVKRFYGIPVVVVIVLLPSVLVVSSSKVIELIINRSPAHPLESLRPSLRQDNPPTQLSEAVPAPPLCACGLAKSLRIRRDAQGQPWVAHPALSTVLASLQNLTSIGTQVLRWRKPSPAHQQAPSFEDTQAAITTRMTSLRLDYVNLDGFLNILSTFRWLGKTDGGAAGIRECGGKNESG
ncbi:hypothetical protein F5146DRAFT_995418 [Armillaria mellea]|nr:hypothetical protein F5146DRAFT_995418 [Armillaria mellea]